MLLLTYVFFRKRQNLVIIHQKCLKMEDVNGGGVNSGVLRIAVNSR